MSPSNATSLAERLVQPWRRLIRHPRWMASALRARFRGRTFPREHLERGLEAMEIQLTEAQMRRLEGLARQRGRSPSQVLEEIVAVSLGGGAGGDGHHEEAEQARSCYELAMASGFVGADGDLPPDLSTNPDHFDGFGRG